MNITNKFFYPQSVVEAVKADLYQPNKDVYRVTELIDSPLIKRLLVEHWGNLYVDVDEKVYSSLFGTAWHKFLASFESDALIEKRWSMNRNGVMVTGQTDIFKAGGGIIEDNKTQSAWAFVFGTPSWERQLNIYAELVEENGYTVNELWIGCFLRDWSKYEAKKGRNKTYPDHKYHRVRVPLWSKEKRQQYIDERLDLHLNSEDYVCTDEDRWRRKTTWAVKKTGIKTAKRVLDTKEEAEKWIRDKDPKGDIFIEKRMGGNVRCESYCSVRSVCPYAKAN
jgi:hypothetical protein